MHLYLNYFKEEQNTEGDNEPIGIISASDKHEYLVKYATGSLSNKIFVSKYQLYLPNQKVLEAKVKEIINNGYIAHKISRASANNTYARCGVRASRKRHFSMV